MEIEYLLDINLIKQIRISGIINRGNFLEFLTNIFDYSTISSFTSSYYIISSYITDSISYKYSFYINGIVFVFEDITWKDYERHDSYLWEKFFERKLFMRYKLINGKLLDFYHKYKLLT